MLLLTFAIAWMALGCRIFPPAIILLTDNWHRQNKTVHNIWFEVPAETGLPVIELVLMLVTATVRSAGRNLHTLAAAGAPPMLTATAVSLMAGLVGFCVAGTFLTQAFTWPLYVLIGLTVALSRCARDWIAAHPAPVVASAEAETKAGAASKIRMIGIGAR